MSAKMSQFAVLKIEEGLDSEEEITQKSNSTTTSNNRAKKNKKKLANARKDINKLLEKLNNPSEEDCLNNIPQSFENGSVSNGNFEDELNIAILHSQELNLLKNKTKDIIPKKTENKKKNTKNAVTMSLREFTTGESATPVQKVDIPLEKVSFEDNEAELSRNGFFTSAKAEKQYKANIEMKIQQELDKQKQQKNSDAKMKEKQRKLLDSKEKELNQLKSSELKLLEEISQVKKRNHQLTFMINTPEMEGKLKLLKEIEELKQFSADMVAEVLEKTQQIEIESNSNLEIRNQIDKLKNLKPSR